ncbi:MAG TPA: hypothetical protein VMG14_03920 [Thermoplasmata archaeon]|nr:hypothetical protein [Thermoplasmata archaeon]HTW76894.1 hypothetical protein [Thermoplasmata archaeon]
MAAEPIYVSPEAKKRLIREANEAGLTLDEYLATRGAAHRAAPKNGASGTAPAPASGSRSERVREMLDQMTDMYMMRSLSSGVMPPGLSAQGESPILNQLLERMERLEDHIGAKGSHDQGDDLELNSILKQAMRYRMMAPILKTIAGDDESGGGSKFAREYEKEMRARVDKVQDDLLKELRERDKTLSDFKEKSNEARLADYRDTVRGLEDRIETLSETIHNGTPGQQGSAAMQLKETLDQAAAVATALEALANRNRPQAPPPGSEKSGVETIAYLANELSGAVSKGLEAFARVNAAGKGHNPDAIGRMPPPGQGPPVYAPAYAGQPPGRPQTPPPRAMRPAGPPPSTIMPPGARLPFERQIQPSAGPVPGPELRAPTTDSATPVAEEVPELPPLDPNIDQFVGPGGVPMTREQFEAARLEHYRRTGVDPVQMYETGANPPPAATPETPAAPAEASSGDSESAEGSPDAGAEQSE